MPVHQFGRRDAARRRLRRTDTSRQHDEIIDAIANHDEDRAEALIRAHLDLSRRNMAMYAAPEGLQIAMEGQAER